MENGGTGPLRGGRLLLLAAALAGAGALKAEIVEYWVPGVSGTNGWYNTKSVVLRQMQ